VLAAGAGLLMITLMERRKMVAMLVLAAASSAVAYLVWDSFSSRMSTLKNPVMEGSARSRIIISTYAAPRMWLDYPLFGVGFTETNQQRLLFKYVPPEYAVEYAGKVIHNNWLQILVDSGIFAFLIYVWLVFRTTFSCWLEGRKWINRGDIVQAAMPNAIAASMATFIVGSTFLSRTSFDLLYVLVCMAAAWVEIRKTGQQQPMPAVPPPGSAVSASQLSPVASASGTQEEQQADARRRRRLARRISVRHGAQGSP
jgi:O-antigen ligase